MARVDSGPWVDRRGRVRRRTVRLRLRLVRGWLRLIRVWLIRCGPVPLRPWLIRSQPRLIRSQAHPPRVQAGQVLDVRRDRRPETLSKGSNSPPGPPGGSPESPRRRERPREDSAHTQRQQDEQTLSETRCSLFRVLEGVPRHKVVSERAFEELRYPEYCPTETTTTHGPSRSHQPHAFPRIMAIACWKR